MRLTLTNNSNPDLEIKSRHIDATKSPPPRRQNQMLCAILCRKNLQGKNENNRYIPSYNEPDLCNNCISKEQGRNERFCIKFPRHCVLGHVLLDTNPLADMDLWKEALQPTRSVDPRKLCWNTNNSTSSNTLDFLWAPSAQQARRLFVWISFINHSCCDLNIQDRSRS